VTQNPTDVPEAILAQLGLKIQHALRAFTARDRRAIKQAAENYPLSEFYDTAAELTSLGIGEALISVLDEKGRPTPLAATLLRAPRSRMDILSEKEIQDRVRASALVPKYAEDIDRESAYEMLTEKIEEIRKEEERKAERERRGASRSRSSRSRRIDPVTKVLTSATFIRGVFGILRKVLK
jgi:hypothetical protein